MHHLKECRGVHGTRALWSGEGCAHSCFRRNGAKHFVNGATCWLHPRRTRRGLLEHGPPLRRRTPGHLDRCCSTCRVATSVLDGHSKPRGCKRLPSRHVCGPDQRLLPLLPFWLRRECSSAEYHHDCDRKSCGEPVAIDMLITRLPAPSSSRRSSSYSASCCK